MNFKLDENLGPAVREVFIRRGHDCRMVREQGLGGAVDTAVEQEAIRGKLWIVEHSRIREHEPQEYDEGGEA